MRQGVKGRPDLPRMVNSRDSVDAAARSLGTGYMEKSQPDPALSGASSAETQTPSCGEYASAERQVGKLGERCHGDERMSSATRMQAWSVSLRFAHTGGVANQASSIRTENDDLSLSRGNFPPPEGHEIEPVSTY
jgi:hypothetical protein